MFSDVKGMRSTITKRCSKCGECKILEEFCFFDKPKNIRRPDCKACQKKYKSENRERIAAHRKAYRSLPEVKAKEKAYAIEYRKDRVKGRKIERRYIEKNKDKVDARRKAYLQREDVKARNRERRKTPERRSHTREYERSRKQMDPVFRIRKIISVHVAHMLQSNGTRKATSFLKAISYTMTQLKEHLEKQFAPWMTWDNYGPYKVSTWDDNDSSTWTWHVDHIIPQSKLPYTSLDSDTFRQCWALENLRPLSAKQNVNEGARR